MPSTKGTTVATFYVSDADDDAWERVDVLVYPRCVDASTTRTYTGHDGGVHNGYRNVTVRYFDSTVEAMADAIERTGWGTVAPLVVEHLGLDAE